MNLLEYYQSKTDTFLVNKHPEKDLYLVKYLHLGVDWSMDHVLDARGLILDSSGTIIARPYRKFFNYKELEDRIDLPEEVRKLSDWENEEYTVTEKVDGSLIIVFCHNGEMVFASSGSFISEHALKAKELYEKLADKYKRFIFADAFMKNTFLFELVSPEYQIVIQYPEEKLILHGIIQTVTGEFNDASYNMLKADGFPVVRSYNYTEEELIKVQAELKDVEGFVVRFKDSGKMLKMKTEDYFMKSKDAAIFFGKFFTYRKIGLVFDSIFDDTYDDLVASVVTHPQIKENIEIVFNFYKELETELMGYKAKWENGEFADKKLIATSPETKPHMHMIFMSLKDRSQWKEPLKQQAFKKFIKEA